MPEILDQPILPSVVQQNLGMSASARVQMRLDKIYELELRGEIKPATIINRSPFELKVETGYWDYSVPPRPSGKPFSSLTVTGTRAFFPYRGKEEMSDHSTHDRFDCGILLPVHQLMEFKTCYVGLNDGDKNFKQGGVIVFEGDLEGITPKSTVRDPSWVFKGKKRFLKFSDRILGDLIEEADAQMKHRCMVILDQADHWADDPKTRANIQRPERVWADFAFEQKWITAPKAWRNTVTRPEDSCPRCGAQYVSKTGMCKCSYVVDPLLAFLSGEILVDHVRLQTLKAEDWKKINAEQERRNKARS